MRGLALSLFSIVSVVVFSCCLFFSDNMMVFWLFLELGGLGLIPSFFAGSGGSSVYSSLFTYIVVSGVSSSLIMCGFLFDDLIFLTILGFLIKFGVFPFIGWVYSVVTSSNWLVVWGISTVLKSVFLFFCFFLSMGRSGSLAVSWCCTLTFLSAALLFWVCTYDWFYYWCHVMICSSAAFLIMSLQISFDLLSPLFLLYVLWASFAILFLSRVGSSSLEGGYVYFLFVFLLVSFPGSLVVFYKLFAGLCIYSCGPIVIISWVVYSVSEQLFLLKYLVSGGVPSASWCGVLRV